MNENARQITLIDFMERSDGWGHDEGRKVHIKLVKEVESKPGIKIFRISLKGIKRTDASFPRESVVELARRYRGRKGFTIIDCEDQDMLDNWEAAAQKREQPLFVWKDSEYKILGPTPSKGNMEIFELVMQLPSSTATVAANKLNMKLTNASTKLKNLCEHGYLLRREELAASGGVEYKYYRIK